MKKYYLLFLACSMLSLIQSCDRNDNEMLVTEDPGQAVTAVDIQKSNNDFAFDIFKEASISESQENYFISPVSLSLALGMAYNGSAGDTKIAFQNTMNLDDPNTDQFNEINQNLIESLSDESDGSIFRIANSIWANDRFPLKENFVAINQEYYSAEAQNLNFGDPSSLDIINDWVSENTNGKIPSILDQISNDNVSFLINAIYFNAKWKYEFDPEDTQTSAFENNELSEPIEVEMMSMDQDLLYQNSDLFTSIILPYKNDRFNMVLMRPKSDFTTNDVVAEMNSENWKTWMESYETRDVRVKLPKFSFDYKHEFKDDLRQLGLGIAFTQGADFSKLCDQNSFIFTVFQKCFITVNEAGTEAAAVTNVGNQNSGPQPISFNKPFIFAITDNSTGSICFIGRIGAPQFD